MKNLYRISVASAFLALSSGAGAVNPAPSNFEIPVLQQETQHAVAAKRTSAQFLRTHFKKIELDDAFSGVIYDRYLKSLDSSKSIYLKSDVLELQKYRDSFDEALLKGNLTNAYKMYQSNLEKRVERYQFALSLLEKGFDFNKADDKYYYDREDADWAKDKAELDELWRQRVKYDALNLKLAGKNKDEIKDLLEKRYQRALKRLSQTKSEDVFQTVMNAFARSIEAHTSYLSPQSADRFNMEMNLSFEGIGAVLQVEDDFTVIRSIIPGGPADLSNKLKPKDKIIGVAQDGEDFVDVIGWRLDEVVDLIKGPKGTDIRLQVLKPSQEGEPMVLNLTRDKIKLEDREAKSKVVIPESGSHQGRKVGVISIPSFYNNLSVDVKREIDALKTQDVEGIIVDLRGNGGGSLTEAILVSGLFIDSGPVVQVRNAADRINVHNDTDGEIYYSGPLTVLVDRYSASASEIFAAAMQDYGRALIVGEQTFGKGTVQQHRGLGRIYDLYSNPLGHVQYTIAKFYRINGDSTQHKGVIPDILLPSPIDAAEWGESQEENALPWDTIERANYATFGDPETALNQVEKLHEKRVSADPEFAYIYADIQEYKELKDKNYFSLVESERLAQKDEREKKDLQRANERLKRMGKEPVASLDDLPEDFESLDAYLDETAQITLDVIQTGKYAVNTNS
ncbi:carboxy terminal-processing peptidase [Paraneptunicella aestuarii]|uniref:carboxy terminal-processing peptidase n=1 Tax=Paraneptunicella aestuarii TaxID=2831148 RepID=UPI001E40CD14|nr:carboxy terminal-processing peptidase [Paraneptunicella aestuarii]UAA37156.1 carboxy terminal-processing peptidase [Paraneptunicella aestuarii]